MILRIYFSVLKIAARYCTVPTRFTSVFGEKSQYGIYKRAFNFHKNGGSDFKIPKEQYALLQTKGLIVDGSRGGLLLGPLHSQGGILVVRNHDPEPCLVGEIEGWEYVLNTEASVSNLPEIEKINGAYQHLVHSFSWSEYVVPDGISVIDMRHKLVDGVWERPLLLISGKMQWCVNKWSTKAYLKDLERLNKSADFGAN